MTRVVLLAACVGLVAAPTGAQSRRSVDALETWINAVKAHQPGKVDRPVALIGTLKYSDRLVLNPAVSMFLEAVRGQPIATKFDEQKRIVELYRLVRGNPGLGAFVQRAAVLHADAAIFRDKLPDFVDDAPPPARLGAIDPNTAMPSGQRIRIDPSPLLANDLAAVHTDGRVVGQTPLNWNWTFADSLLTLLLAPSRQPGKPPVHSDIATEADVAFVAQWYHATSAYLLATGKHADLKRHLARGAVVLPDDAHLLFDRACYAETLGLPIYQVLPGDPTYWNASTHITIDVPSENKTDEESEALFRHAIEVDPKYAEARVRLARLLERRGLHDEAAAQIEQALAVNPGEAVAYFAHIVAGRIELSRGRAADAQGHYRAALAIFPDAQSALLGASQAAVMNSDVSGALMFVQTLGDRTSAFDADPWWNYHLGAGRDVDALMAAVWTRTGAASQQ